jgi:hypothetical protein
LENVAIEQYHLQIEQIKNSHDNQSNAQLAVIKNTQFRKNKGIDE